MPYISITRTDSWDVDLSRSAIFLIVDILSHTTEFRDYIYIYIYIYIRTHTHTRILSLQSVVVIDCSCSSRSSILIALFRPFVTLLTNRYDATWLASRLPRLHSDCADHYQLSSCVFIEVDCFPALWIAIALR